MIESISAITPATHDMPRAVRFYRMLGFEVIFGGDEAAFTSFRAGSSYLNHCAHCWKCLHKTLVWLPSPSPTQAACWYSGPRFSMGEPRWRWCPPRRSVSKFHQPWDDR